MEDPMVATVVSGTRQQPAARGTGDGKRDFVRLEVVEEDSEDSKDAGEKNKLEHTGPTFRWHRSVPMVSLRDEAPFLDTMDE